ncbi:lipopolysaccharide biosynthesis protein [Sphingomonas naphthae]|uniref:Lipopolysaccharide biosynthesis protein n=1 Tax=Sphingomonas naphthae TaxID=1813468 RepID=A0ABY7TH26_9SPHN|nr:lipopolysaccharide biosynthesis protein [Sphingomonas naphthae]WCT72532.1 lipopolysaccharide biosynthesis protein [Sphingomonas naphthae]
MTPGHLDAPKDRLRQRVLHGTLATSLAQAVKFAVQLLSVVILSRMLDPASFGLFAMVMPIAAFVMMFQDMGLSNAVITSTTLSQGQASAMFWINLGLSLALALLFAAAAPLIGWFYDEPRLPMLALALAGTVLVSGLTTQHFALLNRGMRFAPIALIDALSAVTGLGVAVIVATYSRSAWALVASVVASMSVSLIGGWLATGWRPGRPAPFAEVRDMVGLGGGLTSFTLTNFLARNMDKVLIGRVGGAVEVGLYDRAYKLLLFPLQQVNNPVGRVIVPALSRLRDEPHRYRSAYARVVRFMLLLTLPGVAFLIVYAPILIPTLLGGHWATAVPIFLWLGLAAIHQPMTATTGWLFISQQRGADFAKWGVVNAVTSIAAFAIGMPWGAVGVAAAYGLSDLFIRLPAVCWWVGRRGPVSTGDLIRIAAPFLLIVPAVMLALLFVRDQLAAGDVVRLIAGIALSYLFTILGLATLPQGRAILRDILSHIPGRRRAAPVMTEAAAGG